jgi:hypothetical protein
MVLAVALVQLDGALVDAPQSAPPLGGMPAGECPLAETGRNGKALVSELTRASVG